MPKLCEYQNCRERATYGPRRGCPLRCSEHKENMKLASRLCMCGKAMPYFNESGQTPAICCSLCKTETMIDVRNKKCKCGLARPIYNEPGQKPPICCASCKTETMVDVINKRCICGLAQPNYNEPGQTTAICCVSCKTEMMIDVKNKRCKCGKAIPIYNELGQTPAICCASCKTESMVDVINKRCKCGKARPNFNEPGQTSAICCASCKAETMVDIINKRCLGLINNNEPCPYDTRTTSKYKNYCIECYRRNFPLDPLTFQIRSKTKEIAVRDYINANLEGFQHDKPLSTSHCECNIRRRIDHRKLINNTLLVIETDENQHKSYDQMDEETRYDDLYMAFSGKWVYIRFNPDKYVSKNGKNKNPMISTRLPVLLDEIKKQIWRIQTEQNNELVERIYLFYDGYD
jgi:hypothetical protein